MATTRIAADKELQAMHRRTQIHTDGSAGIRVINPRSSAFQGQSTLEYALVIAVAVAAVLAMQTYMKRGVQGKVRDATDQVGEQFSPTAYHGKFKHVQESATKETLHVGTQGKGESKSETTTIDGVTGIRTNRSGQDIGGGTQERLTDSLTTEKCLFPPCPQPR